MLCAGVADACLLCGLATKALRLDVTELLWSSARQQHHQPRNREGNEEVAVSIDTQQVGIASLSSTEPGGQRRRHATQS